MPDVGIATLARGERETFGAPQRSRWSPDWVELELIRSRRRMGAGWNAIAAMLGRPVCDVRAQADPTFDLAFAFRPAPGSTPAKPAKAGEPARRKSRAMRAGRAQGEISVVILECVRDGLVTSRAIAARVQVTPGVVATRLNYCLKRAWVTARRPVGKAGGIYQLTRAGAERIANFREGSA